MRLAYALLLCVALRGQTADHACAACHSTIVQAYAKTPMALSSGKVLSPAHQAQPAFVDNLTGTHFSVKRLGPKLLLEFSKPDQFSGTRALEWFIGSGRVGRSYLFRLDAKFFQSPLSFYSAPGRWQLSPGFDKAPRLDLTRAVEPACLQCHASNITATSMDAGVSCERCHGPGAEHIKLMSTQTRRALTSNGIVNPRKLPAEERDGVCAQCHLTGAARVARYRADGATYSPGKKLADFSAAFVWDAPASSAPLGVTSHFEKLSASSCKLPQGESLTCTTCHNPHAAASSATYNQRCQSCHVSKPCLTAPAGDCVSCHMPKGAARGVDHSSYTDHSIPRRPRPAGPAALERLRAFWPGEPSARDFGLAYAIVNRIESAKRLLSESLNASDVAAMAQLAQVHDREGREAEARPLYEAVLRLDPRNASAATNLAVIRIKAGDAVGAIELWRAALAVNPALTGARMNLAMALYAQGDRPAAMIEIQAALRYDPDQPSAARLLKQLQQK